MKFIQLMIVLFEGSLANIYKSTCSVPWGNATEIHDFVGSTVIISCPENVDIVLWTRNGELLSKDLEPFLINGHQLQISNVSKNEENTYCCEYTYQNTAYKKCSTLKLTASVRVRIKVFPSSLVSEGENVTLSCLYDNTRAGNSLIWTKDGSLIEKAATWSISNVTRSDSGMYLCSVNNANVSGCDDLKLSILDGPYVKVNQQDMTLHCKGIGFSHSDDAIKWEHFSGDGKHLRYLNGTQYGTLQLNNTEQLYYKLDGKYKCVVSDLNTGKLYSGSKHVSIKGKPICTKPQVGRVFGRKGHNAVLATNIYTNNGSFDFWWFKSTVKCNYSSKYNSSSRQSLVLAKIYGVMVHLNSTTLYLSIANLTQQDLGTRYTVQASNRYGKCNCCIDLIAGNKQNKSTSDAISLCTHGGGALVPIENVRKDKTTESRNVSSCVPRPPYNFGVKLMKNGMQCSWLEGFDGGYSQFFKIMYRSEKESRWKTVTQRQAHLRMIDVYGLGENTKYYVYMYAQNVVGRSIKTGTISIQTSKKEKPVPTALRIYVVACIGVLVLMLILTVIVQRTRANKA